MDPQHLVGPMSSVIRIVDKCPMETSGGFKVRPTPDMRAGFLVNLVRMQLVF